MTSLEYRGIPGEFEVRETPKGLGFSGYAAVFNRKSDDLGGFRETIRPGAFTKSLSEKRDVRMFLNHDDKIVLGSTRAGTLRLNEDDRGLKVDGDLPANEWGRPVADAIERGDIHTMSFGFRAVKDAWTPDQSMRDLIEVKLFEVSPVTGWAAYPQTTAQVRALAVLAAQIDNDTDALRSAIDKLSDGEALGRDELDLIIRAAHTLAGEDEPVSIETPVIPVVTNSNRVRLLLTEMAAKV